MDYLHLKQTELLSVTLRKPILGSSFMVLGRASPCFFSEMKLYGQCCGGCFAGELDLGFHSEHVRS